jgi:hypothetical protein
LIVRDLEFFESIFLLLIEGRGKSYIRRCKNYNYNLVDFKISCTTLYRGTERGIGKSEAAGFAAYGLACTVIAGGEENSVDFAMMTETARGSENVNFVDDADTIACDDRERIANSPSAGHLNYLRC